MHRLTTLFLILAVALAGCAFSKSIPNGKATSYTFGQGSVTTTETVDPNTGTPVIVTETKSDGISETFAFGIVGSLVDAAKDAVLVFFGRNPAPDDTEE